MHIVYDYQIFASQAVGGISRYFVQLASALTDLGDHRITVLAPWHKNRHLAEAGGLGNTGHLVPSFPGSGRLLRKLDSATSRRWLDLHRPDVMHATFYYPTRAYRPAETKLVVTVHDMIHELFPERLPDAQNMAHLKRQAVTGADHVICVSQTTCDDLVRLLGIRRERISVIYHGAPPSQSAGGLQIADREARRLLYVGHRGGYKNFDVLVQALATAPLVGATEVICFGGGPFTAQERRQIRRAGLRGIQFRQLRGDDDALRHCYATATALVAPSAYEGFGLPVLEAMALGCPVLCSANGAHLEVAGDAAITFGPADPAALGEAIARILTSPDLQRSLSRRGRERAERFTWRGAAQETLEVYQSVLGAPPMT